MTDALYAGTFDPPSNGHLWVALEGLKLFDVVTIGVAENPKKKPMFSAVERVLMWKEVLAELVDPVDSGRIIVRTLPNEYTVRFAKTHQCGYLLRGIRTVQDYHDESTLQSVNHGLEPSVRPVYLMAPPDKMDISSSLVKGMIGYDGWQEVVAKYVPKKILDRIIRSEEEKKRYT
jgi:pantetheine-phosphate adenylyltransferase